jgi:hypothetical protein
VFRLLLGAIAAIFRPRALLIAENLCLRQQLLVLQRGAPAAPEQCGSAPLDFGKPML